MQVMMEKPWTREDELELLALVQLGLQTGEVEECHSVYLSPTAREEGKTRACMLGAALIGKAGGASEAYTQYINAVRELPNPLKFTDEGYFGIFSKITGVNKDLLHRASYRHIAGVTIDQQITELRNNCYN